MFDLTVLLTDETTTTTTTTPTTSSLEYPVISVDDEPQVLTPNYTCFYIESPNYPDPYPANLTMRWLFQSTCRASEITFETPFDVGTKGADGKCHGDYISLQKGTTRGKKEKYRHCGNEQPTRSVLINNNLDRSDAALFNQNRLVFKSDAQEGGNSGFRSLVCHLYWC